MALLFHPPPLFSLSIPPKRSPKPPVRFSASSATAAAAAATNSGAAIVWYKHDLRIEDHPGLIAASQHPTVVPLYVFDRRIISRKLLLAIEGFGYFVLVFEAFVLQISMKLFLALRIMVVLQCSFFLWLSFVCKRTALCVEKGKKKTKEREESIVEEAKN